MNYKEYSREELISAKKEIFKLWLESNSKAMDETYRESVKRINKAIKKREAKNPVKG